MAVIFSQGKPFRTKITSNFWFSINIFSLALLTLYMFSGHSADLTLFLQVVEFPEKWLYVKLFALVGGVNVALCWVLEKIITEDEQEIFVRMRQFLGFQKIIDKIDRAYGSFEAAEDGNSLGCAGDTEIQNHINSDNIDKINSLLDGIVKEKLE